MMYTRKADDLQDLLSALPDDGGTMVSVDYYHPATGGIMNELYTWPNGEEYQISPYRWARMREGAGYIVVAVVRGGEEDMPESGTDLIINSLNPANVAAFATERTEEFRFMYEDGTDMWGHDGENYRGWAAVLEDIEHHTQLKAA